MADALLASLSEEDARRKLTDIIRSQDEEEDSDSDSVSSDAGRVCSEDVKDVIMLCKAHESFVMELFFTYQGRRIRPLEFLISSRASLEEIRSFVDHFPKAVKECDLLGRYPLHWACECQRNRRWATA